MHFEVLVEDSSGATLLELLIPMILGDFGNPHTWRVHPYKGIGRLPAGLQTKGDPEKRILLEQLPRLLRGYGKTPGIDAVVVVLDSDSRDCTLFLDELQRLAAACEPAPKTMFRLAIEEVEAWYLGDQTALLQAYPKANRAVLASYEQDSVCGTWELLADAVHPGGSRSVKKAGWPLPGQLKHEWAGNIAPHLDVDRNRSSSFNKLCSGLRRLADEHG